MAKRTKLEISSTGDIMNLTTYAESAAQWLVDATSIRSLNCRNDQIKRELTPVLKNWCATTRTMNQINDLAKLFGLDIQKIGR